MAKQLNVNLAFQADTSQALRNIQDLQKALNSLSTIKPMEGLTLTKDMQVAVNSAKELERHLGNAFNANTGNFDLSRLNTSLKASNTDLATLTNGLLKAGIQGEQAFMKVQRALSTSAVQIKQANGALTQFWTTLKNTARWQLSSSIIHGFMGSLQQAYGYAQDLDKSLNNIRIVTGASNAEMSKFAEAANKAAKELKTTTTAYTNASLIYYQQGLNTEEVKQRTDVTVKMANAAGVSAEKVSDQLTAVWNNFAKGGENLEYYADVMTALGASTASSTDEIATGLEKFAAVAETVGLSYEYATSALATVTAETRQSADVVGTAFKTLFARIQGLQLGETLDDGTTLNKYSQALAKVGIDIMDTSGEMKKMDVILDEMAGKWNILSNAQQVALAQTVGGVRQYNQLISLMDNWDVMQTNLVTAKNSSGTLEEQAKIYEESWEAASKNVKASFEGLYTDLIPTDAIIDITNGFADVIESVDEFIQGMGGLKSILLMVSTIALNKMAPSLGASLQTGIDKVKSLDISFNGLKQRFQNSTTIVGDLHNKLTQISSSGMNSAAQQTKYFSDNLEKSASTAIKLSQSTINQALNQGILTDEFQAYVADMSKVNNLQALIEQAGNRLTQEQKEQLAMMQQQVIAASERHQQEVQNLSILQSQAEAMADTHDISVYQGDNFSLAKDELGNDTGDLNYDSGIAATETMKVNIGEMLTLWEKNNSEFNEGSVSLQKMGNHVGFLVKNEKAFLQLNRNSLDSYRKTVTLNQRIKAIAEDTTASAETRKKKIDALVAAAQKECNLSKEMVDAYAEGTAELKDGQGVSSKLSNIIKTTTQNARDFAAATGNGTDRLKQAQGLGENIARGILSSEQAANQTKIAIENVVSALHRGISASMNLGTTIVKVASGLSTIAMGANALNNMFTTLGDSSATGLEKFSAVATGSVMAIQGLMVVIKGLNALMDAHTAKVQIDTMMQTLNNAQTARSQAAILLNMVLKKQELSVDERKILMEKLEQSIKNKGLKTTLMETAANYGLAASEMAVLWPLGLIVAILSALAVTIIGAIALVNAFTVSNEEMAERTAEASKNLGEAAKAAKEEAQGIKDAFTEYDEVVDALNSCTKGTDEWREALEKVKGKVSEILDQYPDLLKYEGLLQWNDEAGAYMFNTDSSKGTTMDDVIAQADKRADTLAYASQMASGKASAAKANVSQDTYNNKTNGYVWDTDISQMTDNVERNKEIIREEARKYIEAHPESYTQDADYYLGLWEQSINSAAQAGADYATKVEEAGNIMLAASQMAASEILSNEDGTSDYDQASANAGAAVIQKEYDRIYDEIYGANGANGLIGSQYAQADNRNDVGKHGANDVLTRYEAAVGKDIDWAANAVQGNNQNRTFVYLENGEEKQLSPEQIAATIAAYESTQNKGLVEDAANTVQNIIGELTGNEDGLGAVTAISNGGEKSDMANVFANMTEGELADINKMFEDGATQEEIAQAFGMTTDQLNTMLETFGIDFQTFADNCTAAATEVAGSLTEAQQEVLTNAGVGDTSGMTMEEKIAYSNNISSAKSNLTDNELGENLINDIIGDVENADVDPEQMSKFIGAIGTLDLTAEDAAEQVAALAEEYGIEGVAIDNLISGVQTLDQVYSVNTGNIAKQAASLKKIVGDGLSIGDEISEEDLKVLEDAGINVDQYFTQMADGTYALTGNAKDFNKIVNSITLDQLKEQINDFNAAKVQATEGRTDYTKENLTNGIIVGSDSNGQDLGKGRLDYINSFEAGTFEFNTEQRELLAAYTANPEIELTAEQLKMVAEMISVVNAKAGDMQAQMFLAAGSVAELKQIASEMDSYSWQAYEEGLINLASNYDNCSKEIEELQQAMLSGDKVMIKTKMDALVLSTTVGELSKKFGLNAEEVEIQAKLISDELKLSAESSAELAIQNQRMNKGVKNLNDNWKEWKETLTTVNKDLGKVDKTSQDYAKALNEVNKAVRDLTGVHEDFEIPSKFYELPGIMEDIEKASKGDIKAINNLGLKLAKFSVENLTEDKDFQNSIAKASEEKGIDNPLDNFKDFDENRKNVIQGIQELQTAVLNGTAEINGAAAGMDEVWAKSLNEMAMQTGMSVDEMNSLLNAAGVDAEVVVDYADVMTKVPVYTTETSKPIIDEDGSTTQTSKTWITDYEELPGKVPVAQINMGENGKTPDIKYIGNGTVAPKETGTGTGGKSKRPQRTHKSDTVERYKEVNDQLDDVRDHMEDASRAADGLWGPERIKKMRQVQDEMRKELKLLRDKRSEAQRYLAEDQANLQSEAIRLGIGSQFQFDGAGNITNYTQIMSGLHDTLAAAQSAAGADPTETQQKALDDIEYKISEIKKAIGIYDETRETLEDIDNEIEEKILELQQEKFDEINLELEVDLVVNETQLKELEYYLSKLEDNFFGMAEALALMIGNNENGFNQLSTYQDSLIDYQEQYARLLSNYTTIDPATGATYINQAQFIEGLQEVQNGLYENLGALQDLSKEMIHYYGDVLAAAGEELEKFTSLMDHHSGVLDHYANLLDLLGRSKDFKSMKTVLAAQVETAENAAKVSKANYNMLEEEARKKKEILDNTTYDKDSYEYSVIKQEWLDAENAANEAQDQMLSDAEAWAESLKTLLETELDELADILEKSLSGEFGTLDNMIESMERANSLQEEYLTSTNQIYETNKLMRQAQQEIDKSTNSVAKRRLKQFIDETNQMQNQNKLSQFELDIQKAKYDLLLAEIALEEAQQAKSTVSLQRDSEGNFGYVYTADQNEVAQAQQDLEDAQNALYNIGLEGANKYGESYAQTLQQMNDDITALTQAWLNGEIASKEEYQRRMLELEKYYGEKLMQYSELRTVALGVDSRIAADAWTKDFAHMTTQTEMWMRNVDQYAYNVGVSMDNYQKKVDDVEKFVGLDLDSLKDKTKNITDENKTLASTIQDDLIPKIKDEITAVSGLTAEYIKLYDQIRNVISASETLAASIGKTIKNESDNDDSNNLQPTGVGTSDSSGSSGNSGAGQVSVGGRIDAGSAEIYDFPGAPGERQYFRNDPTYTVLEEQGDWIKVRHHSLSSGVTGWFRKGSVAAMNTGGYTGDWAGSYGKLAFLHQKEMVLNAQDTENLLTSIEFLDKIISTIDLYSSNARLGGLLSTPSYGGFGNTDTLEQNVHIEASFPNVSDHNEIEEALNNLINKASQYAYRK